MKFPVITEIKWKLTLMILGPSVAVLLIGAIAVMIYDAINSRQNLVSQIETIADITAANSAVALAFADSREARETLETLRGRTEIDFAGLYTANQKAFAHFSRANLQWAQLPELTERLGSHFVATELVHVREICLGSDTVGFLLIRANIGAQQARFRGFLLIAVVTLMGLISVALGLAARLQRLVSGPITQLATAARYVTARKDYSIRVESRGRERDEISALVAAFNQMLTEIERQNQNLFASESRLKLALNAAQMGTWEWNLHRNTISWSAESDPIFGCPGTNLPMEQFTRLLHPEDAERVIQTITRAIAQRTACAAEFRIVPSDNRAVWVALFSRVQSDHNGTPKLLTGIVQDVSERKKAEAEHQKLVARLLHSEDEERRRIARELHDTTAQHLVAIKMTLVRITQDPQLTDRRHHKELSECTQLVEQALQETRTLTYVLHPPLLDEFGLVGALRDFASGVARRSGVQIRVELDGYSGRMSHDVELALFRVIQESLTNAIRHSGSKEVLIRLERDATEARVEVQDSGCGLPGAKSKSDPRHIRKTGVGIAAMHERLSLLGGHLMVESDPRGVTVLATVPLNASSACPPPDQPKPIHCEKTPHHHRRRPRHGSPGN